MGSFKLKDRIEQYQSDCDYRLMARVPIITIVNGRSFSKLTQLLDKPYCSKFSECILSTMLRLCSDVEGVLFAYQHNDEIVIVSRNDQNIDTMPWLDNRIQKICSVSAAIATIHFNQCVSRIQLDLGSDPIFTAKTFTVPNVAEAINTIVYKQQQNFHTSIQFACVYELLKKYDKNTIKEMLSGLLVDEKIDLLNQECSIDFNDYPLSFRRGTACYRMLKVVDGGMKNKWFINDKLPIFTKDTAFLGNIFRMGNDIFGAE